MLTNCGRLRKNLIGIIALLALAGCGRSDASSFAAIASAQAPNGYYMIMFALEGPFNEGTKSHTFATFVAADGAQITEDTISYMPADSANPAPLLRAVSGRSYDLETTLSLVPSPRLYRWGPYKITKALYDAAQSQLRYLATPNARYFLTAQIHGITDYRVRAYHHQPGGILNCVTAVADLAGLFDIKGSPISPLPRRRPWGSPASLQILDAMTAQGSVDRSRVYPDIEKRMQLPERFGWTPASN